jgi:hypothetical protein
MTSIIGFWNAIYLGILWYGENHALLPSYALLAVFPFTYIPGPSLQRGKYNVI